MENSTFAGLLSLFFLCIYRFLPLFYHVFILFYRCLIISPEFPPHILSFFIIVLSFFSSCGKAAWIREIIVFFGYFLIIWECGLDSGGVFCIIWDSSPASGDHDFIIRQSALDSGAHTRMISCNAGRDFMRKDICPFVCHATCSWLSAC